MHVQMSRDTTQHQTNTIVDTSMSDIEYTIPPSQIGRQVIDYDLQIREGLEEGNVRQVMKELGDDLVSRSPTKIFFYSSF